MRILVTGGAGYIGSHTVKQLLARGHEVTVFDNLSAGHRAAVPADRLVVGDLRDIDHVDHLLVVNRIEAVVHFAAHCYVGESVKEPAKYYDTVTFNYTAWDSTGKMFDSTEMRKRPASVPPFRQARAMEELLTSMVAGERTRFWVPAEQMTNNGKPLPGMPTRRTTGRRGAAPWRPVPLPPPIRRSLGTKPTVRISAGRARFRAAGTRRRSSGAIASS